MQKNSDAKQEEKKQADIEKAIPEIKADTNDYDLPDRNAPKPADAVLYVFRYVGRNKNFAGRRYAQWVSPKIAAIYDQKLAAGVGTKNQKLVGRAKS